MLELLRNNFQITGVLLLVIIVFAARLISNSRAEKHRKADLKRIRLWNEVFYRCEKSGSYKLSGQEISWFYDSDMLRALDFTADNGHLEACSKALCANSKEITYNAVNLADTMEKGFLAYMVSAADFSDCGEEVRNDYIGCMLKLLGNDSVYCRENSLKALYNLGDAKAVAEAVGILTRDGRMHNEKLLADGLNSFGGDKAELAGALMDSFSSYDDHNQSAVITFLTTAGFHEWDEFFAERLNSPEISIDQRCDILRLLLKAPSGRTKRILIDTLKRCKDSEDWQMAAVAATGLDRYQDDAEVIDALRYAIDSRQWNVRINCAFTLVNLDPPGDVLDGILNGSDKYAADALRFAMNSDKDHAAVQTED